MKWESYSHPISDVRDWNKNNHLELQPDFQRNVVWTKAAQIMLIDTILRGIPIPKVYIKSIVINEETYRIVVDGQQRLTAILNFIKDELVLGSPYKGEYKGRKFSELPDTVRNDFIRYKIDINEIFNPTDEEIRDLYSRVNKYTVQLNKQELRKADFPGDYIRVSEQLSELKLFSDEKIFTVKQRRRMLDVEYVEELLAVVIEGIQDKKDYLDDMCEKYMSLENASEYKNEFIAAIDDISRIFDSGTLTLRNTRFKQKADFYSLFAAVVEMRKSRTLVEDNDVLNKVRDSLKEMDKEISPQSKIQEYLEYATRCLSDANSKANRIWRRDFVIKRIQQAYFEENH